MNFQMDSPEEVAFLDDLMGVYQRNKRKINRALHLRKGSANIYDFCADTYGQISYENVCHLALVFSNVLGAKMPDHIHVRMILGNPNLWVREYVKYVESLRPRKFGVFNVNPNNYRRHTLGPVGWTPKLQYK